MPSSAPGVVNNTRAFALKLYDLLRDLDPLRWQSTRKENLRQRVLLLEVQVKNIYHEIEASHPHDCFDVAVKSADRVQYPLSLLQERLFHVQNMLNELSQIDIEHHLSYFALRALRKRLQKAYNSLCIMMEAYQAPIPHIRPSNLVRSSFHFLSAMAILGMIELVPHFGYMFWIALAYFVFCWSVEGIKHLGPKPKARIMAVFSKIAHPHEYDKVNSATWYGTALLVLAMTNPTLGVLSVTILGVADPVAASVGRAWGKIPMPGNRTLEGSVGFVFSGTLAGMLVLSVFHPVGDLLTTFIVAGVASLCGAIAEYAGKYPDDNLTIPVASAVGASLTLLVLS
jgi:dolichol kinase